MHVSLYPRNQVRPTGKQALTLIETLCLLTLATILVFILVPKQDKNHARFGGPSKIQIDIAIIKTAVDRFHVETGKYPVGTNDLQDLFKRPLGLPAWNGPYLTNIPRDPWGNEYRYDYPGHRGVYDIYSAGPGAKTNRRTETEPELNP